jgi:hypothetical protein
VHSRTGITPFEGWWGTKPNLKYLKLFGARVCVKQTGTRRSKLDKHNFTGLFLGYTSTDQNIRYLDLNSGTTKSCHHATFDKAWYLQDNRPPAAQLLDQLGLEDDPGFSTCPPDGPFEVALYPPASPLSPPDTSSARMHNLPLRLSPAPLNATLHSIASRSPHAGTCIAPHNDTTTSLSYGVSATDVAQIYMSPTPYNDAFEEELDLRKINFTLHRTAGMSFIPQDTRLILASMVPSTPGARIPRWRTRLRGAWLLSVDRTPLTLSHLYNRHSTPSPSVKHLHASYSSRIRRSPTESPTEASYYLVATSSHNRISTNSATDGLLNLLSLRIYPKPLIGISSLTVTFGTL